MVLTANVVDRPRSCLEFLKNNQHRIFILLFGVWVKTLFAGSTSSRRAIQQVLNYTLAKMSEKVFFEKYFCISEQSTFFCFILKTYINQWTGGLLPPPFGGNDRWECKIFLIAQLFSELPVPEILPESNLTVFFRLSRRRERSRVLTTNIHQPSISPEIPSTFINS